MLQEQIKERIKLKVEFMKFYFIAMIGLITGVVTLVLREKIDIIQKALIASGRFRH